MPSVVALLEGLRVDAFGINCGMEIEQMIPILEQITKYSSLPVIVKPNAGLPKQKNGQTYYDVSPEEFAEVMKKIVEMGAVVIGGCCGTTPDHIKAMADACRMIPIKPVEKRTLPWYRPMDRVSFSVRDQRSSVSVSIRPKEAV